jgi:hypothetical protein
VNTAPDWQKKNCAEINTVAYCCPNVGGEEKSLATWTPVPKTFEKGRGRFRPVGKTENLELHHTGLGGQSGRENLLKGKAQYN